jgi:hypothetical protein
MRQSNTLKTFGNVAKKVNQFFFERNKIHDKFIERIDNHYIRERV